MTPGLPSRTPLFPESPGTTLKPPLKWAGGKRWLVPTLQKVWQQNGGKRLVEPFVGGMAIALGLQPQTALLNDVNVHLINFYTWLQRGLKVNTLLENDKTFYYLCRDKFNTLVSEGAANSQEAAELFYYLNRTCFNGLCRFNSKGGFNVPYGRYKSINYTLDLSDYAATLKNWQLQQGDFSEIVLTPDDFIYADPPYDVEFTAYSSGGFSWRDQERLAVWLSKQDVPVIVSNQATQRVLDLYKGLGFELEIVKAPRRISCNGDRTPASEIIATKNI